jgi:hypothetical protein
VGAINIPFLFQMNKKHIQKCLFMNKNTFFIKKASPKKGGRSCPERLHAWGENLPPLKKGKNDSLITPLEHQIWMFQSCAIIVYSFFIN